MPARFLPRLAILSLAALLANVRLMGRYRDKMSRLRKERTKPTDASPTSLGTSSSRDDTKPLPFPFPHNDRGIYELEFVHIPKTGGTSIEMAAANIGIAWGMCKFAKSGAHAIPKRSSKCKGIRSFRRHAIQIQIGKDWRCSGHGTSWHCPPWEYEGGNKFENVSTFAVVRNPYDRMISEYYYFFSKHGNENKNPRKRKYKDLQVEKGEYRDNGRNVNDPEFMNRWIAGAVQAVESSGHCYMGHCMPFHKWVYADDGRRAVTHVLRMENLTEDFGALMDRYHLPIKLEERHNARKGNLTLGVEDLSNETIAKINTWAELDFKLFGYEMLDTNTAPPRYEPASLERMSLSSYVATQ